MCAVHRFEKDDELQCCRAVVSHVIFSIVGKLLRAIVDDVFCRIALRVSDRCLATLGVAS